MDALGLISDLELQETQWRALEQRLLRRLVAMHRARVERRQRGGNRSVNVGFGLVSDRKEMAGIAGNSPAGCRRSQDSQE